jgi:hypothetical protein
MPMKMPSILVLLFSLLMVACFEEDHRARPYPGNVYTIPDSIQVYQSYFDLETGTVKHTHRIDRWEIGFECGPNGWHVVVNSGAGWFIFNTQQTEIDASLEMPASLEHLYDVQSDYPDSTAVGNWVISEGNEKAYTHHVYLLANYRDGSFFDKKQLVFLEVNDSLYRFFYKEYSDSSSDTVFIHKADTTNFVYYSFRDKNQVNLEPNKEDYDLVFLSYYDLATKFGVTIPYPVGGAFINVWQTQSCLDSVTGYEYFSYADIDENKLTSQRDIPGYRWKDVSVDISGGGSATYSVKAHYTYVFKTPLSHFYKLRFLSYTLDGRSGYPRFEYRQLSPADLSP